MNAYNKALISLIRWNRTILFISAILLYLLSFYWLTGMQLSAAAPYLSVLSTAVAMAAMYFIIKKIIKYGYSTVNVTLSKECDPSKYIAFYRELIRELSSQRKKPDLSVQRLNLSTGYIAYGEYDRAIGILKDVTGNAWRTSYLYNMCSAFTGLGDWDKAQQQIDEYKGLLPYISYKNDAHRKAEKEIVNLLENQLKVSMGQNASGAEKVFRKAFEKSQNNINRVTAMFYLGEVYLHKKDVEKAVKAFEYVVSQGNRLSLVKKARKRLQSLA